MRELKNREIIASSSCRDCGVLLEREDFAHDIFSVSASVPDKKNYESLDLGIPLSILRHDKYGASHKISNPPV
jgi:hypothetical protein